MMRIAALAKSDYLGINFSPSSLGAFILFKHERAASFAHNKAVATFAERARSVFGVVVAGG